MCACVCVRAGTDAGVTACGRAARQAGRLTHRWSGHGPSEREARAEAAQGSVSLTPGPELRAKPSRCLPAGLAFRELGRGCGCSGGADRAHASSGPRGQLHLVPVASASLCDLFRPFPGPEGGLHLASLAGGETYTRWFRQVPADEDPEGSARGSTWRCIFQGVRCPHTPAPAGPPGRPLLRGGLGEVPVCLNQSCEASEGGGRLSQAPLRRA